VLQKGGRPLELLSDFLEISRIEAGYVDLEIEEVRLGCLVSDCLEDLAGQVRRSDCTCRWTWLPDDYALAATVAHAPDPAEPSE